MAKRPKGFGQPPAKPHKTSSKPVPPKPKVLQLEPLPDCEFLGQKEKRLRQLFAGMDEIPPVTIESLRHFAQHLQIALASGAYLKIKEPLPWEIIFIYGPGTLQAHERQRRQSPSYLDQYQFAALHEAIDPDRGLQINVQRVSDRQSFTLPLNLFTALPSTPLARVEDCPGPLKSTDTGIADYRFWWEHYRPLFPLS